MNVTGYRNTSQDRMHSLLLVTVFFLLAIPHHLWSQPTQDPYKVNTVVIDSGHGGKDPGTLGRSSKEKDIALGIALKLGTYIEDNLKDVKVIYTRKSDVFVKLHKRGDIANKAHADLFISIHVNWFSNPNVWGPETYVMGLDTDERNLEVAKKENSVITFEQDYTINYEGFDPNSTESYIIFNLMQNEFLDQSLEFASLIQSQFKNRARRNDRGVRQAGFVVLWNTTMPSVLVETGYISNSREEEYLKSQSGQEYIASAIFRAFREYKSGIESMSLISTAKTGPEIMFSVQVVSSKKKLPLNSKLFKGLQDVEEIRSGTWYKYTVGKASSYEEIKTFRSELRNKFKDAFIVGIKEGKIIPLSEALKEINN